jgi:hypothetical protein
LHICRNTIPRHPFSIGKISIVAGLSKPATNSINKISIPTYPSPEKIICHSLNKNPSLKLNNRKPFQIMYMQTKIRIVIGLLYRSVPRRLANK